MYYIYLKILIFILSLFLCCVPVYLCNEYLFFFFIFFAKKKKLKKEGGFTISRYVWLIC